MRNSAEKTKIGNCYYVISVESTSSHVNLSLKPNPEKMQHTELELVLSD